MLAEARLALSLDTLQASWRTVTSQQAEASFMPDGSMQDDVFGATLARIRDHRAVFLRGVEGYIEHNLPPPAYVFSYRHGGRDTLRSLRHLIAGRYRATGTDTIVLFSPAHVWQWELLHTIGLEPQWLDFRRQTASILVGEAERAGRKPFALYDLARFDDTQSVAVPALGDVHRRARGYWDASHFTKQVGDRALENMIAGESFVPGLGPRLDPANVEPELSSLQREGQRWRASHADDVAELRSLVACYAAPPLARRLSLPAVPAARCVQFRQITR
jgi:hypothetical protein